MKPFKFRKELFWTYLSLAIAAFVGVSNLLIFLPKNMAGGLSNYEYLVAVVSSILILMAVVGFLKGRPHYFIPFIIWDFVLIVLKIMGFQVAFLGVAGLVLFCMGYGAFYKFIDKEKMAADVRRLS